METTIIRVPPIEESDLSQWLVSAKIQKFADDILWLYNDTNTKHTKEIKTHAMISQKPTLEKSWQNNQNYTLVQTMKYLLKNNSDISFESEDLRSDKNRILKIRNLFEAKKLLLQEEKATRLQAIQWDNEVDDVYGIAEELKSNKDEIQQLTLKINALTTFCAVLTSYIRDNKEELKKALQK